MTWREYRVKDAAGITNGHPFDATQFSERGELALVRIRDLVAPAFTTYVPRDSAPEGVLLNDGDIVIGMDGDFNAVLWRRGEAALNQRLCALRTNPSFDRRFLAYLLPAPLKAINDLTYSTTVKHLSSKQIADIRFLAPDAVQQGRIADYLDRETAQIDALIAKQERLIVTLRERRMSLQADAVTRGLHGAPLRDSGVEWLGLVPSHWEIRPLWTLFERIKNVGHPTEQMLSVFREFGVVVKEHHANLNQTAENRDIYQLVHPGWLVSNRMKAWQGSVGISRHRGIVSGHYICFAPRHDQHSGFLDWLFRSSAYAAGYGAISRGVRIGQAEIDNDLYRVMPVLLPPVDEQAEIAKHLDQKTAKIDALIAKAERFIELSKERRSALITAAVTGQLEIPR